MADSDHGGDGEASARQTFAVDYRVHCNQLDVERIAQDLAVEQTLEFPADLATEAVAGLMLGRVEAIEAVGGNAFRVRMSYPFDTTAGELTQFLNVVFGNASLLRDVRVENIEIDPSLLGLPGPRFGIEGMRELLGVESRPLLATALKPMGLGAEALASLAYRVARGGIDIIKDDHGLTNQHTAPFRERVSRCAEAVQKANRETQKNSLYLANVSADCDDLFERAEFARQAGAGGLLVAPGLVGFSGFAKLASRDDIALPMMSHPAFSGGWLASERAGIDHRVLLGTLQRLVGADMVVFPHASGRFPFSLEDCKRAAHGLAEPQRGLRPALAVPAGGMTLDRVPELWDIYGSNVVLLIGGDLFRRGPDMEDNARQFLRVVERRSPTN